MSAFLIALHVAVQIALIVRVLLRPHREPTSRLAWAVIILVAPIVGIVAYLLFGEVNVGRTRLARTRAAMARIEALPPVVSADSGPAKPEIPPAYSPLFAVGRSVGRLPPVGGNAAQLMADSAAAIESMVADIDAATETVHAVFYIWLDDASGLKIAEALRRAASRGVTCRVLADDLGSRAFVRSAHWQAMADAGVRLGRALPIGNLLMHPLRGRVDLRNHRKILVIDNHVTYCGSQNCCDAEFRVKPKYAPWVDIMLRFEGPVARQNQVLFAGDWLSHVEDDDLDALLTAPLDAANQGFPAQVIGTGPTMRYSAMPEMFEAAMYTARHELLVTTPYYVPDEPLQMALCAAARRGVATRMIMPARNDSWIVAAASRSYYPDLLDAGVRIFEFEPGLLHAKTLTLDGDVTLVGSANVDRRSFQLNYENNILLYDKEVTSAVRARQEAYLAQSHEILPREVAAWPWRRRLWNNTVAMFGPVL